jgi:hypothetical protein
MPEPTFPTLPDGPVPGMTVNRHPDGQVDLLDPGPGYIAAGEEFFEPIAHVADTLHPWLLRTAALVAFDGGQSAGPVEAVRLLEQASELLYAARTALAGNLARALAAVDHGGTGFGHDLATHRLADALVRAHGLWDRGDDDALDALLGDVAALQREVFSPEGRINW